MSSTLIDSCPESNYNNFMGLNKIFPSTDGYMSAGSQSFKTPTDKLYRLTSVKFRLHIYGGNPIGHLVARLYAHTGTFGIDGKPTGEHLAESEPIDIETLTGESTLIEFVFSGNQQYLMEKEMFYCVSCLIKDGNPNDTIFCIALGMNKKDADGNPNLTHEGNEADYIFNSWGDNKYWDLIFYVYGEEQDTQVRLVYVESSTPKKVAETLKCSGCGQRFLVRYGDTDKILKSCHLPIFEKIQEDYVWQVQCGCGYKPIICSDQTKCVTCSESIKLVCPYYQE